MELIGRSEGLNEENEERIRSLFVMLKALADINRLKILILLFDGERCVCDIEEELGISQPLTSHHLRILSKAGLIKARKEGTWSYYSLRREGINKLNTSFSFLLGPYKIKEDYPMRESCDDHLGEGVKPIL